jgi:hypothetical protein
VCLGVIAGDLNADCSYASASARANLALRTDARFANGWLIDDNVDTTTSATDCAYDRFIVNEPLLEVVTTPAAAPFLYNVEYGLNASFTTDVSDHYPIEMHFLVKGQYHGDIPEFCPGKIVQGMIFKNSFVGITSVVDCAPGFVSDGVLLAVTCQANLQFTSPSGSCTRVVFFSEVHFNNVGADVGEGFEITGPAGTDLSSWAVTLYNGASLEAITVLPIPANTILPDEPRSRRTVDGPTVVRARRAIGGWGTYFVSTVLQNGPSDGLALSNTLGIVVDFISWEGPLTPISGPAASLTAQEIPVRYKCS